MNLTTVLSKTIASNTGNPFDELRLFCKTSLKKHRKTFHLSVEATPDVLVVIKLSHSKILRLGAKLGDQVSEGDSLWLVTTKDWNEFKVLLEEAGEVPLRAGKPVPYLHPTSMSKNHIDAFIKVFTKKEDLRTSCSPRSTPSGTLEYSFGGHSERMNVGELGQGDSPIQAMSLQPDPSSSDESSAPGDLSATVVQLRADIAASNADKVLNKKISFDQAKSDSPAQTQELKLDSTNFVPLEANSSMRSSGNFNLSSSVGSMGSSGRSLRPSSASAAQSPSNSVLSRSGPNSPKGSLLHANILKGPGQPGHYSSPQARVQNERVARLEELEERLGQVETTLATERAEKDSISKEYAEQLQAKTAEMEELLRVQAALQGRLEETRFMLKIFASNVGGSRGVDVGLDVGAYGSPGTEANAELMNAVNSRISRPSSAQPNGRASRQSPAMSSWATENSRVLDSLEATMPAIPPTVNTVFSPNGLDSGKTDRESGRLDTLPSSTPGRNATNNAARSNSPFMPKVKAHLPASGGAGKTDPEKPPPAPTGTPYARVTLDLAQMDDPPPPPAPTKVPQDVSLLAQRKLNFVRNHAAKIIQRTLRAHFNDVIDGIISSNGSSSSSSAPNVPKTPVAKPTDVMGDIDDSSPPPPPPARAATPPPTPKLAGNISPGIKEKGETYLGAAVAPPRDEEENRPLSRTNSSNSMRESYLKAVTDLSSPPPASSLNNSTGSLSRSVRSTPTGNGALSDRAQVSKVESNLDKLGKKVEGKSPKHSPVPVAPLSRTSSGSKDKVRALSRINSSSKMVPERRSVNPRTTEGVALDDFAEAEAEGETKLLEDTAAKLAQEKRKAEAAATAARLVEEARRADEEAAAAAEAVEKARMEEEARLAVVEAAAKLAEEVREAEAAAAAEQLLAEEARAAEAAAAVAKQILAADVAAKKVEEARLAEEARVIEQARQTAAAKLAEETRIAEEAVQAAAAKLAEEAKAAEAASRPASAVTVARSGSPQPAPTAAQLLQSSQSAMWFGYKFESYRSLFSSVEFTAADGLSSAAVPLTPIEVYYAPYLRTLRVAEYVQTVVASRGSNLVLLNHGNNTSDVDTGATKLLTTTSSTTTYGTFDTSQSFMSLALTATPIKSTLSAEKLEWQSMEYMMWALFQVYGKMDGILVKTIKYV